MLGLRRGYSRRGIEAVTLRAVGERAGVSRQAPYKHFADKEALLSVLAGGYFERLGLEMWGAAEEAGGEPYSRLRAIGEVYVRFALEGSHRYRLMFGEKMQRSPHPRFTRPRTTSTRVLQAVADCQEPVSCGGDPPKLAALIYATVHGAVDLALAGQAEGAKGHQDPLAQLHLLLFHLRTRAGE